MKEMDWLYKHSQRCLGVIFLTLLILLSACTTTSYHEPFISTGSWRVGDDLDVSGEVKEGQYHFLVKQDVGIFWTTANKTFSDGLYSVDVAQVEGIADKTGYGLMWRVNDEVDDFYLFEISADGYAKLSLCNAGCAEEKALVGDWWFASPAIAQGLGVTNTLKVEANIGNMIFFINDTEIGRVTDNTLTKGDVGLFVETLGIGNAKIIFDNVKVDPLPK